MQGTSLINAKTKPIVFFDIETSGLDPVRDEITQIAAVVLGPSAIMGTFEVKILVSSEAQAKLAAFALEQPDKCNYDQAVWATQAVAPKVALNRFAEFLKPWATTKMISAKTGNPYYVAPMAGHNVMGFDKEFLFGAAKKHGVFLSADFRMVDTLVVYLEYCWLRGLPMNSLKLEDFVEAMGKKFDGKAHDALVDVTANALAYAELNKRRIA
jgi:oligoribonuclease (3'-5' exoribonuclease)